MVNYPNGKKHKSKALVTKQLKNSKIEYGKRGMRFEEEIDLSNQFYMNENIAVIHKKPTPVQIVDVSYPQRSQAVIKEAYFRKPSTTDYNGIYKGKYIDFEAKATQNKTSFPLNNIHKHQVTHMQQVTDHGAICFILFYFSSHDEVYLLPFTAFKKYWSAYLQEKTKSIPYCDIQKEGIKVSRKFQPRIDYIQAVNSIFFYGTNESEEI